MIKLANPALAVDSETKAKVNEILSSGSYILGEETGKFEEEFAKFCGSKHGIAVSSGTAAIHITLAGLGLKSGDEVITTTHSFIATANPIVHCGAKPVLADIDPHTFNIDPSKIEEKITKKTKGIIPVHLYGHPADMKPIMEIAEKHGLFVLEDSCQAHGAEHNGRKVGSIGSAAAFSFFPSKVMTVCGDGGMVTTNDNELACNIEMLRNQGRARDKKYEHDIIGFNYRTSEVAAAIGRLQLRKLPVWLEKRRQIAAKYNSLLSDVVTTPVEAKYAKAVYYVYTVMAENRDGLREHLKKNEIESGIYYPVPIHMQPAYKGYAFGKFPVAEKIAKKIISLPMHQFLSDDEVKKVAESVEAFYSIHSH